MTRTFTLLLLPAENPDQLDDLSYEERRTRSGGSTRFELLYPGDPDTLVRMALAIDQGVYGAARAWDESCVEHTAAIFPPDVQAAAEMLRPHLRDPLALATRFIAHAESGEDPARVARALTEAITDPARGPAEEAATYVRVFLENVPAALELRMCIAWEIRTPASCACSVWEGPTMGRYIPFPPRGFERLEGGGKYFGSMRCARCGATFEFKVSADYAEVTREGTPLPKDIGAFAREVAGALGGEVTFEIASSPTCAVRIGQRCVILIWLYGAYYRIGLPLACPWKVGSREDWIALKPAIEKALAGPLPPVSMAEVIASLPREWNVGLQGEPRPEEALLYNARGDVQLKQNTDSVTITIWEGSTQHVREVATLDALGGLSEWIHEKTATQTLARQAALTSFAAEQAAAHAAMLQRAPTVEDVMSALRDGHTIQVGGGRSFVTYEIPPHGNLVVIHCDDGFTEAVACSEQRLREAITEAPHVFASVVDDWRAGGSWNRR
jgi:hypothetical protein